MKNNFKTFEIKKIQAPNFIMNPVELKDYLDFEVKRIYFITHPIAETGSHCHKTEKEFFVLVQGSCVAVIDYGEGLKEFVLEAEQGNNALYVSNYVWHHFKNFSKNAILLALSSTNYNADRNDYIEDYKKFKRILKNENRE